MLMTGPLLTVRLTGVAKERVVTAPRKVRKVAGNIMVMDDGGDGAAKVPGEPTDQSGVLIERCLGKGRKEVSS